MPDQTADAVPAPQTEQPAKGAAGPGRWVAIVAAVVAGLGGGLLIGYLAFDSDDASTLDGSAQADVDAACAIVNRVHESHAEESDWGALGDDPATFEVIAAGQLLDSAAVKDDQYEQLSDLGRDMASGAMKVDFPELIAAMDKVADECD